MNADGSFLAFGQGTSGTVTRAVDTRPGGGAVALKSIPVTLRYSRAIAPAAPPVLLRQIPRTSQCRIQWILPQLLIELLPILGAVEQHRGADVCLGPSA